MSQDNSAWGEVAKGGNKGKSNINNLKLENGKPVDVRFVSAPKKFYKYFVGTKSAICADPENCSVRKKYGQQFEPGLRYAIVVIDRTDGQVKLFETAPSVLKPVAAWGERRKRNPADPQLGLDWTITRTGEKKNTRYEVVAGDPTPLTEAEQAAITAAGYDLEKLFKATPDSEIEARLFGGGEQSTQQSQPAQQTQAAAPVATGTGANAGVELPF
jgi:hypothetical protein